MISPHTAPGTKVVCVDDVGHHRYQLVRTPARGMDGLTKGQLYTVTGIHFAPLTKAGYGVELSEIKRRGGNQFFALERFKLAPLPECLTSILDAAPVDADEKEPA